MTPPWLMSPFPLVAGMGSALTQAAAWAGTNHPLASEFVLQPALVSRSLAAFLAFSVEGSC